ncbi:MAG TPA: hypothetical protein VJR49_03460, partial [Chthoniobacterales bacterium]|nr:hypothetical protein [Chthoniobacterales bacterium]
RGEKLMRSVQENAASRTLAIRTREQVCERPGLFIGRGSLWQLLELRKRFPREAHAPSGVVRGAPRVLCYDTAAFNA